MNKSLEDSQQGINANSDGYKIQKKCNYIVINSFEQHLFYPIILYLLIRVESRRGLRRRFLIGLELRQIFIMKKSEIKILLVDDEPDILEILKYNLSSQGYQVFTAKNGLEGVAKARKKKPHLIILDVMMPGMDGMEACEIIRNTKGLENTLIVFLTARAEDYSQVAGLDAGADDYITKPIKPKVLVSKIKALLRRLKKDAAQAEEVVKVGNIIINREEYKVINKGDEIFLPRKEFELLALLASKPDKVFKREVILDKVWGQEVVVGGRTIDVHIRKLREKIGDDHFKTVKGVGYKFVL